MLQRSLRRALVSLDGWPSLMALTRSSVGEMPFEVKRSPKLFLLNRIQFFRKFKVKI